MHTISAEELAGLVPCPLAQVQRLIELQILQRDDEGGFDSSQVHVVRLMAGFEAAGISVEDVARGVRSGQLSFPLGLFMPEPAPITTKSASRTECASAMLVLPERRSLSAPLYIEIASSLRSSQ